MYQEGEISISQCERCHSTFPVFTFVADTDMPTIGCVALTAPGNRLLLTEQLPRETTSEVEARIGNGFRIVPVRFIKPQVCAGISFQEFRKRYRAPEPIYTCISCGGDSKIIEKKAKEEFLKIGSIEVREIS